MSKWIGWILAGNWDSEVARSRLVEKLGAEALAELEPQYPAGAPVTVPPGATNRRGDNVLLAEYRQLASLAPLGGGSNNWAVDGEKSVTGKPLLASDPHLPAQLPNIWYEAHIQGGELDAIGATIPGLPGVAIGHNRRIAWGVTASMGDQQDLFIERLNPENPHQYECEGGWRDAEVVVEQIFVPRHRGRPAGPLHGALHPRDPPPVRVRGRLARRRGGGRADLRPRPADTRSRGGAGHPPRAGNQPRRRGRDAGPLAVQHPPSVRRPGGGGPPTY